MSGMNWGINVNDPTVVAAFKACAVAPGHHRPADLRAARLHLDHRAGVAARRPGRLAGPLMARPPPPWSEPSWRRLLRIGFGLIWVFDGILQAQPKMAIGLPSQVIQPTAAGSPHWVQQVVNWAGTNWSYHPMQAGASAVWIQVGIGIWLLAAPRGPLSRLAGLVSVGWGFVVWAFGESFGGIFAPGLTWLFGAPGAVAYLHGGGGLIALPERAWRSPLLGRAVLAGPGAVPGRDGRAAGLARPRVLAGGLARPARHPGRHDRRHGPDTAARVPGRLGQRVHRSSMRRTASGSTCSSWWRSG